jgi:hypothetical protein
MLKSSFNRAGCQTVTTQMLKPSCTLAGCQTGEHKRVQVP